MSGTADTTSTTQPVGAAVRAPEAAIRLVPDDPFPEDLAELPLEQLQILHSRICRQMELEYLTSPDGGHPITLDRRRELQIEFDSRVLR